MIIIREKKERLAEANTVLIDWDGLEAAIKGGKIKVRSATHVDRRNYLLFEIRSSFELAFTRDRFALTSGTAVMNIYKNLITAIGCLMLSDDSIVKIIIKLKDNSTVSLEG